MKMERFHCIYFIIYCSLSHINFLGISRFWLSHSLRMKSCGNGANISSQGVVLPHLFIQQKSAKATHVQLIISSPKNTPRIFWNDVWHLSVFLRFPTHHFEEEKNEQKFLKNSKFMSPLLPHHLFFTHINCLEFKVNGKKSHYHPLLPEIMKQSTVNCTSNGLVQSIYLFPQVYMSLSWNFCRNAPTYHKQEQKQLIQKGKHTTRIPRYMKSW